MDHIVSFSLNNEEECDNMQKLLFVESTDDEDNIVDETHDQSDSDEEDAEPEQLTDYDTEQDVSENENCRYENLKYFLSKDKLIKWNSEIPKKTVRMPCRNMVSNLSGVKACAKNKKTISECWSCFIDANILHCIIENTNKYIASIQFNYSRERDCKPTNVTEIKALLGLLYLAGYFKASRLNLEDLWADDGVSPDRFRLVMSLQRFRFLLRALHFDDCQTRMERKKIDKLAPIRTIFEYFVKNCQVCYNVGEYLTLDEKWEEFRGRCSFKQYIPSKPGKYGVKVFCLTDAKIFYTVNLEIYAGKQPDGPYQLSNSPKNVVLRLASCVSNAGRNVTTDSRFTSYELGEELLKKQITLVGTVRKNKKQIPSVFVACKQRELKSTIFGFNGPFTLLSYKPKNNKNIIILSTMHHDNGIDSDSDDFKKPAAITFYNATKCGVDMIDKMSALYTCARNTRRWQMVIFYSLLNIAGINSQIIYNSNNVSDTSNKTMERRYYLRSLAIALTEDYVKERVTSNYIPKNLKRKAENLEVAKPVASSEITTEKPTNRKRCYMCTRKENRMTRNFCDKCNKFICLKHGKLICVTCASE